MARVNNTKREVVMELLAEVSTRIAKADKKLLEELDLQNKLNTTYKSSLDSGAKDDLKEVIKFLRWLLAYLNIQNIPSAYTDSQIDTINEDIIYCYMHLKC